MTEQRWKAEEYKSDFRQAIGVIMQFFPSISQVVPFILEGATVLEIGIGSGKWSAAFAIIGCNVVAVDNNYEILENYHKNFPQIYKATTTIFDDAKTLNNIPNKFFDLVFSEGLVEHFLDDNERRIVIVNMFKKLKDSGMCLCLVPRGNVAEDEKLYPHAVDLIKDFSDTGVFESVQGFELEATNEDTDKTISFVGVFAKNGSIQE
jgi:cyclopropane fatty-acyl-phospholipid synthase-like methyltransferase